MLLNRTFWNITDAMLQGVLLEVSTRSKPGLVCYGNAGCHKDMSILTFMASSAALTPYFYGFVEMGYQYDGPITDIIPTMRKLGVEAEQRLLESTAGINTQRGALFCMGILGTLAGYLMAKEGKIDPERLFELAIEAGVDLVDELKHVDPDRKKTAGEQLYEKYGVTGIRGEAAAGFPGVRYHGLPAFKEAFAKGATLNQAIVHVLLSLCANVDDTTILWRSDMETLRDFQSRAQYVIDQGSVFTAAGEAALDEFNYYCRDKHISPGGCADLVGVTIAVYLWENKVFPEGIAIK